jgi:hypothetical protein
MNFKKFAPLAKVDLATGTITGIATSGLEVDRMNERLDYFGSKDAFRKWSDSVRAATNGKSLGNLREMHQSIAAGYLTALNFDDANQTISISGKVVDQNTLRKCELSVLNSLSIGGSYASKVRDPLNPGAVLYVVGQVLEISLVDMPACASCQFELTKRDGTRELRKRHTTRESESGQFATPADRACHTELDKRGFMLQRSDGARSDYAHPESGHSVSVHRTRSQEGAEWHSLPPGRSSPHSGQGPRELAAHLDGERQMRKERERLQRFPTTFAGPDGEGMTTQEAVALLANREPVGKHGGLHGLLKEAIKISARPRSITIGWKL